MFSKGALIWNKLVRTLISLLLIRKVKSMKMYLLFFFLQHVPLLPHHFLQLLEWARPLEEAPAVAAPLVGAPVAPAAWTVGFVLERPTACTPTHQTRTSSTTAAQGKPTLSTVLPAWSSTAPVLVATGPEAEVIDWLVQLFKGRLNLFYIWS